MTDRREISTMVFREGEARETLEILFDALQGEETDATERLERFIKRSSDDTFSALAAWVADLDGRVAAAKIQQDRLKAMVSDAKAQKAWAIDRVRELLTVRGVKSHHVGTWTFRLRKGTQRAVMMGDWNENTFPAKFTRYPTPEPDKVRILVALKDGEEVPGFVLERGPEGVSVK